MPDGPLTLPAELCLLTWDTRTGKPAAPASLPYLVRAGALTELALRGMLLDDDGTATPVPDAETGDPVLDGLLELIEESRPRTWKTWVGHDTGPTLRAVRAQLRDTGRVGTRHRRVLGVFPVKDHVLESTAEAEGLRERALRVLHGPGGVAEVSDRDAALIALAAAGELRTVVSAGDAEAYQERIAALGERGGLAAPALKKVMGEVQAALIAAVTTAVLVPTITSGGS
ncbi:GPP34 family phosphoprotein [Streptomyces sp. NPDC047108]|uniref:GOLPH3/VPS74 family protein n=1 Tax=Streptomyces sp. NPDC047108 TaxID=3155025 RepID=UPI00340D6ECC